MNETVERRGGHMGIAENIRPWPKLRFVAMMTLARSQSLLRR